MYSDENGQPELKLVFEFCEYDLKQYMKKLGGQLQPQEVQRLL